MSAQPQAGADTRSRIIEAALGLIADRGMTGVTMKAVATAAEISRQTLYNHYSDVDGIVTDSLQAHQQGYLDELRSILVTIESPSDRLEHLVRNAGAVGLHHHPIGMFGQALSAEARALLGKHEEDLLAIIVDTLQAGIDSSAFRRDIDVARDARLVMHMLNATAELAADDSEHLRDVVATSTRTVMAAVTPKV